MAVPEWAKLQVALKRYANNPLVPQGGVGEFDELKTGCRVVRNEGARSFKMWYEGIGAPEGGAPLGASRIGFATSDDGFEWTKHAGNPIVEPSFVPWENEEIAPKTVLYEAGAYRMWVHGGGIAGRQIGLLTSANGLAWTRYGGNPILSPGGGGAWDAGNVAEPCVIRLAADSYRMYYTAWPLPSGNGKVGLATSTDGISWTKYAGNPIMQGSGIVGAFDRYGANWPWVEQINGYWHMFYAGIDGTDYIADGGIGYAFSEDGITWTRGATNPVWLASGVQPEGTIGDTVFAYVHSGEYYVYCTGYWEEPRSEAIFMAREAVPPAPRTQFYVAARS